MPALQVDQLAQSAWFDVVEYVPLAHAVQRRSVVVVPLVSMRCPGAQSLHATHGLAAFASSSHIPAAQSTAAAFPPAQYCPAAQAAHWGLVDGDPGVISTVPAWHASGGKHVAWFGDVLLSPSGHAAHTRSLEAVPAWLTNEPAPQLVHSVQVAAFFMLLNEPLPHAMHIRSETAVGSANTFSPGKHSVATAHGVAALLSWSHSPDPHVTRDALPPAQYVPGGHVSQSVGPPPARISVPAGQLSLGVHDNWFGDVATVPAKQGVHA